MMISLYSKDIQRLHINGNRNKDIVANLSFNFNYNLVIAEISFTLQFSNHPPTQPPTHRKSSDNCDISAVTDQILMKI